MLLFFLFLIAAGTAFFSAWNRIRLGPVNIYTSSIETPYGTIQFDEIRNAKIESNQQPSMINPQLNRRTVKLLIIEERSGKAHIFSEKDYRVQEILNGLKEAVADWEAGKE